MKALIFLVPGIVANPDFIWLSKMLNEMQDHYDPSTNFDPEFFSELVTCLQQDDDAITLASQNNAWKGMVDYWRSGGEKINKDGEDDSWGLTNNIVDGVRKDYLRTDPTVFGNEGMMIHEPCNYVSNVAYYHSVTEICKHDWKTMSIYQ